MKKMLNILIGVLLVLCLCLYGAKFATKNKIGMTPYLIDMVNPFVKGETVYGKVGTTYDETWKDAANGKDNYGYNIKTLSISGEERVVQITSFGKKITNEEVVVEVQIKGQYVSGFKIIKEAAVPNDILKKVGEEK